MSTQNRHSNALIQALLKPRVYESPVTECRLIETHISWVILTGRFAYKIKKPVDLGFLDFSTLDKRRYYCNEELRLNRRLAADIYLAVVPICGPENHPEIAGQGAAIEYAVKMREFPQAAQLDRMLKHDELGDRHVDAIARMIARFHRCVAVAGESSEFGTPQQVCQPVEENFTQIRQRITKQQTLALLDPIQNWSTRACQSLASTIIHRKRQGFVRECHGDMHLRNLAWVDNVPVAFDCIEFNPNLRWIDVISEVAFLVMDLQDRGQLVLAQRFLNAYLEQTGDYEGLALLPFYLTYRAMVRAKVAAIRLGQDGIEAQNQVAVLEEFSGYLTLAQHYIEVTKPCLIITRGLSASGKSTVTQHLLQHLPAIRIRSDIERKRLYQVPFNEEGGAAIYTAQATEKTYTRLMILTEKVLDAGQTVIIDAVNGNQRRRQQFHAIAAQRKIPYILLDFVVTPKTLRERIVQRPREVSDAGLVVLESQLKHWQDLPDEEAATAIKIDAEHEVDIGALQQSIVRCCSVN